MKVKMQEKTFKMRKFFNRNMKPSIMPDNQREYSKEQSDRSLWSSEKLLIDKLRKGFDAAYYLTKYPDVLASGIDPLEHFLAYGWRERRRPNDWFDAIDYLMRHPDLDGDETNPFVHFMMYHDLPDETLREDLQALGQSRVLYWTGKYLGHEQSGRPIIVASNVPNQDDLLLVQNHFDADYYISQNSELAGRWISPLLHFMTLGWLEMRDPSSDFSMSYYLRKNKDIVLTRINPFVHYLRHRQRESWRESASVADSKILNLFELDPKMIALVDNAKKIEPMVAMPDGKRVITSPLKNQKEVGDVAQALRRKFAGKTYRYIVAVPHVRMSGASRVASIFANALAQVRDRSEILVITTDSSENEYKEWFSDDLEIFDLSKEIEAIGTEDKSRALVDVMRGVNCRTIINVNSRLVWEAMRLYGRQLNHEFRVVTYLFTWDENVRGDRVGYPIQWLRDTADHHHLLLTDTKSLATDVSDRLGFDLASEDSQVVPLYTPVTGNTVIATRKDKCTRSGRFLWVGRFDPQKRLDILIAIARANPKMTFDVYGKPVLGKKGLSEYDPPENIIAKGTYTDLQQVLDTAYDGFLYTSQWDGLPTILLDMAAAELPIVAPNVGGIGEMLDDTTGWLVDNFEDVESYSAALAEMIASPLGAAARAQSLKVRLQSQFGLNGYIDSIKKMVSAYDL